MINLGTAAFDTELDLKGLKRGIADAKALMLRRENAVAIQLTIDPNSLKAVQAQILGALVGPSGSGGLGQRFGASIAAGIQGGVAKSMADIGKEAIRQEGIISKARIQSAAKTEQDLAKIRADASALEQKILASRAADERKAQLIQQQGVIKASADRRAALAQQEADERKANEARSVRSATNDRQDQIRQAAQAQRNSERIDAEAKRESSAQAKREAQRVAAIQRLEADERKANEARSVRSATNDRQDQIRQAAQAQRNSERIDAQAKREAAVQAKREAQQALALQRLEAAESKANEARSVRSAANDRQDQIRQAVQAQRNSERIDAQAKREAAAQVKLEAQKAAAIKREESNVAASRKRQDDAHAKLIAREQVQMARDVAAKEAADRKAEANRDRAEQKRVASAARSAALTTAAAAKEAATINAAQNAGIRQLGNLATNLGQSGVGSTFKLIGTDAGKKFVEGIGGYKGAIGAVFNTLGATGSGALISSLSTAIPGVRQVLGYMGTSGGQGLVQTLTSALTNGNLGSTLLNTFRGIFSSAGTAGGSSLLGGLRGALTGSGLAGIGTSIALSIGGSMLKAGASAAISFMKTFADGVLNLSKALFQKVAEMSGNAVKGTLSQLDKSVDVAGSIDTDSKTAALLAGSQNKARGLGADVNDANVQAQFRQQALVLGSDASLIVTPGEVANAQKLLATGGQTSSFIQSSLKDIITMSNILKQDVGKTVGDVLDITASTDFTKGKNGETLTQEQSDALAQQAVKQIFGSVVTGRTNLSELAQSVKYSRFGDGSAKDLESKLVLSSLNTQAGLRGSTAGTAASAFFENIDRLRGTKSFEGLKLDDEKGVQKNQVQVLQEVVKIYKDLRTNAKNNKEGLSEGEYLRRLDADTRKALDSRGFNYLQKLSTLDIDKAKGSTTFGKTQSKDYDLATNFVLGRGESAGLLDKLRSIPVDSVGSGKRLLQGSIESVQGSVGFALAKPVDQLFKQFGAGISSVFGGLKSKKDADDLANQRESTQATNRKLEARNNELVQKTDSASIDERIRNAELIRQNNEAIFNMTKTLASTGDAKEVERYKEDIQNRINDNENKLRIEQRKDINSQDKEKIDLLLSNIKDDERTINGADNQAIADTTTFNTWQGILGKGGVVEQLTEFLKINGPKLAGFVQTGFTSTLKFAGGILDKALKLFNDESFIQSLRGVFNLGATVFKGIGVIASTAFKALGLIGNAIPKITNAAASIVQATGIGDGAARGVGTAIRNNTTSNTAQAAQETSGGIIATITQGFLGGLGGGVGQLGKDNGANLQLLGTQLLQTVVSIASFVGQIVGFVIRLGSIILGVVLPPINNVLLVFNQVLSTVEGVSRVVFSILSGFAELIGSTVFKLFDITFGSFNKNLATGLGNINKISSLISGKVTDGFSDLINRTAEWSDNLNNDIGGWFKGSLPKAISNAKRNVSSLFGYITSIDLGAAWKSFSDGFERVKRSVTEFFIGSNADVTTIPGEVVEAPTLSAGSGGTGIGDQVVASIRSALTKLPGILTDLFTLPTRAALETFKIDWGSTVGDMNLRFDGFKAAAISGLESIGTQFPVLQAGWDVSTKAMTTYSTAFSDAFRGMLGWFANQSIPFVQNAWKAATDAMNVASTAFSDFFRGIIGWFANQSLPFLQNAWKATTDVMNVASTAFSDAFRGMIGWIGNVSFPWLQGIGTGVINFLKDSIKKAGDFVKNIFADMGKTLQDKFTGPIAWISEKLQGVVKAAQDAMNLLQGGGDGGGGVGGAGSSPDQFVGAVISILEAPSRQGRVDVAQAVANRVANNYSGFGSNIRDQAFASGQFQPFFSVGNGGYGIGKGDIQDQGTAIAALTKAGYSQAAATQAITDFFNDVRNSTMIADSKSKVANRSDFKGTTMQKYMGEGDFLRNSNENFFHNPNGKTGDISTLFAASNAIGQLGNALNAGYSKLSNATGSMANTQGYTLYSTGGGSYEHKPGYQLRPHHNMNGAYNTGTSGITKNSRGQGVYDMTLESETGDIQIPIPSPVSGKVVSAGLMGGYGNTVVIESGGEQVLLAHMERLFVKAGQTVNEGTELGIQGGTGGGGADAYAVHLHLEASAAIAKRYADRIASGYYNGKVRGGGGNKDAMNFGVIKSFAPVMEPGSNTSLYNTPATSSIYNTSDSLLSDAVTSGGFTDSVFTPKIHQHVVAVVSGGGGNKDGVIGGGFGAGDQADCNFCKTVSGGGGTNPPKVITPTNVIKPTNVPTLGGVASKTPNYKSLSDIVSKYYRQTDNNSYDTRGMSFGFTDSNGSLPSDLGLMANAASLSEALKGYSNVIPIDQFEAEKKAREQAIKDLQDKISGNKREDLLGDAKAKIVKLQKDLVAATEKRAVVDRSIVLSQKEFANKNAQKKISIDAQLVKDNKDLTALYDRYGGKDKATKSSASFTTIRDKLMSNLSGAGSDAAKESAIKEGIASLKGSTDEVSFRRLLLLEAAQREYNEVNKRERGLDKDTKLAAVRDKQIARFGTYLTGLDRSIAEKEFAIAQLTRSKENLETNSGIDSEQLDIATKTKKTNADKAVTDTEAAIKAAKKDLVDLEIKQKLQEELEKLQNDKLERDQNTGDVKFKQIDAYLRSRGYNPTYDDVLKIYLRSKQIEQSEGMLPSRLDENVRKALFEAGLFGAGSQYLNSGNSVEFPSSSVYDLMSSSGVYAGLGGAKYGSISASPGSRTSAMLDITGGATVGIDNRSKPTGGGGTKTLRFQFEGIDETQLVSHGQIKRLENYINDPMFVDEIMEVMIERLRYDPIARSKLGLR